MNENRLMLHEILRNECRVLNKDRGMEGAINRLRRCEEAGEEDEARRLLADFVERFSHGENTVLYDDAGVPSVMVRVPAMRCGELLENCGSSAFHPAFMAGNRIIREVWVSKYLNCVVDGRAASLPMCVPQRMKTFDEADAFCRKKGAGWMPMPFQLYMAIALWCHRHETLPTGNNDHGHDFLHPEERGISREGEVSLTGSGPLTWSHNGRSEGIRDLNGNLNEWEAGLRLMDGEIQVIEMQDLMMPDGDFSTESSLWHALDAQGKPLPAGTAGALHYGAEGGSIQLVRGVGREGIGNCAFLDIRAQSGLRVPDMIRLWGLFPPEDLENKNAGWRWINTEGEVMPLCGGAYGALDHAGVFFAGMTKPRKESYALAGVRCVYVDRRAAEEG